MWQKQSYNGENPSGRHIIEINQRNTSLARGKQRQVQQYKDSRCVNDILDIVVVSFYIHWCLISDLRISTLFGEQTEQKLKGGCLQKRFFWSTVPLHWYSTNHISTVPTTRMVVLNI